MPTKLEKGNKGEEAVINALSYLEYSFILLNNVTFLNKKSNITHQIDHILIHPYGVFVIETKAYTGKIIYDEYLDAWIREAKGKQFKIKSPLKQNKSHEIALYRVFKGAIKVIGVVVFANNNAPYMGDENIINLNNLVLFVESFPYERILSQEEMIKIKDIIKENEVHIDTSKHLENIKTLKEANKIAIKEKTYAIENMRCPRCGGTIKKKKYTYSCSNCDFKFCLD